MQCLHIRQYHWQVTNNAPIRANNGSNNWRHESMATHALLSLTELESAANVWISPLRDFGVFAYSGISPSSARSSWMYLMAASSVANFVGFLPVLFCPIARRSSSNPRFTFFTLIFSLAFFSTRFWSMKAALALSALVLFRRPLRLPLLHAPTTPSRLGNAGRFGEYMLLLACVICLMLWNFPLPFLAFINGRTPDRPDRTQYCRLHRNHSTI